MDSYASSGKQSVMSGNENIVSVFAGNLRKVRLEKGRSQEQLAHECGIDRSYISGCERGVRNPSLKMLGKLANALGVEAKIFLDGDC